jgi:hypothetical protein
MTDEQPKQSNIYHKIAQVILHENTQKIAKNSKGYTSDDVYAALRTAMAENNLICIPNMTGHDADWITFKFTLVDADSGESITSDWHQKIPAPNSFMTADKCIGAASTYAHKYFLMRTFMLTSSDDPKIDQPDYLDNKTKSSTSTQQKAVVNQELADKNNAKAELFKELDGKVVNISKIYPTNCGKSTRQWGAKIEYDDIPGGAYLTLYPNHFPEIDRLLGFEEGTFIEMVSKDEIVFSQPLSLKVTRYHKKNKNVELIPDRDGSHPMGFNNPQVLFRFKSENKNISDSTLCKILDVDKLENYKADIFTARLAVKKYNDKPANVTTMPSDTVYGKKDMFANQHIAHAND